MNAEPTAAAAAWEREHPVVVEKLRCLLGRLAADWHASVFAAALPSFEFTKSRVIGHRASLTCLG